MLFLGLESWVFDFLKRHGGTANIKEATVQ
jgi:hypothetical protein